MLQWSNELSVGVAEIDRQHQELIRRLNNLMQSMAGGTAAQDIPQILDFLGQYTVEHFATEERLMARHAYPSAASHKLQHQAFIREFTGYAQQCGQGVSSPLVLQIHRRLSEWLVGHISKTDKLLGAYLKTKLAA